MAVYTTPGTEAMSRAGKPINVADMATVQAVVTTITGYGSNATVVLTLASGGTISVQSSDIGASAQTL